MSTSTKTRAALTFKRGRGRGGYVADYMSWGSHCGRYRVTLATMKYEGLRYYTAEAWGGRHWASVEPGKRGDRFKHYRSKRAAVRACERHSRRGGGA